MRFKSNRGLGLPRLVTVALILGILMLAPLPLGRIPVEAWTDTQPDPPPTSRPDSRGGQADGDDPRGTTASRPEPTSLAVEAAPTPDAAADYAGALAARRSSLIALLVGTLAVLLLVRWHLTVRGRQHYPRS